MSDRKNDGGPAFPSEQGVKPSGQWNQTWEPGMSLRDWFAGQALTGLGTQATHVGWQAELVWRAYSIADAMLAARKDRSA